MRTSCCQWIWMAAFALAGCGGTMDEPPPPPDRPDAGPIEPDRPVCEFDHCGLPSDDPCCAGTDCANWDLLGPVECAAECETSDDCPDSGCCVALSNGHHTCGPAGFCDAGGALPEYVCNERFECGEISNRNSCIDSMTQCVGNLTDDQQLQWINAMNNCGEAANDGTCDSYYTYCWLNYVPWC